jgi:hypothetical protein
LRLGLSKQVYEDCIKAYVGMLCPLLIGLYACKERNRICCHFAFRAWDPSPSEIPLVKWEGRFPVTPGPSAIPPGPGKGKGKGQHALKNQQETMARLYKTKVNSCVKISQVAHQKDYQREIRDRLV